MALPDPEGLWRAAASPATPATPAPAAPADRAPLSPRPLLTRHAGITNGAAAAAAAYQEPGRNSERNATGGWYQSAAFSLLTPKTKKYK